VNSVRFSNQCRSQADQFLAGLLLNLADAGGPDLDFRSEKAKRPTSLRTSDRNSLLRYMGLPLHTFGSVSPDENVQASLRVNDHSPLPFLECFLPAIPAITTDRDAYGRIMAGGDDEQHCDPAKGLSVGLADQCERNFCRLSALPRANAFNRSIKTLLSFMTRS
jgi:hypothetical protein